MTHLHVHAQRCENIILASTKEALHVGVCVNQQAESLYTAHKDSHCGLTASVVDHDSQTTLLLIELII